MFLKIGALKNFASFAGKHLCGSVFLIKLHFQSPATLSKRDFNTAVLLSLLQNVQEQLFLQNTSAGCFCYKKTSGKTIFLSLEQIFRSSHPKLFLGNGVLKICKKFTGEHPCRSAISHFGMGALLQICCIFSKHLFLKTPLGGCFWIFILEVNATTYIMWENTCSK